MTNDQVPMTKEIAMTGIPSARRRRVRPGRSRSPSLMGRSSVSCELLQSSMFGVECSMFSSLFQLGKGEGTVMDVAGGGTIEKGGFDVLAVDVGWEFVGDGDVGKG